MFGRPIGIRMSDAAKKAIGDANRHGDKNKIPVNLRLDPDRWDKFKKAAHSKGLPYCQAVERAMQLYLIHNK